MNGVMDFFLYPISPILSLVVASIILIALECFPQLRWERAKFAVAITGCVVSIVLTFLIWNSWPIPFSMVGPIQSTIWLSEFAKDYRLDPTSLSFFLGIGLFTLFSLVFMSGYFKDREIRSEVFILVLFIASGMMLLVSADNLLMAFLALELLSLPTYVLVGIHRKDRNSCEAALKYFLFGSFATVLFVVGITLLYAQFGTFQIPRIAELIKGYPFKPGIQNSLVYGGLASLMVAIGFKVGLVPFHMWLPDTYEGAAAPITGFMGSAVKMAGFGLAVRLLWGMFLPLMDQWSRILDPLAVLTMFVGNIAALKQNNLKRMFAYSSIAHAGYLMLGITSATKDAAGLNSLYYYLLVYGLMFVGLFAILTLIEQSTKSTDIGQLTGLGETHPGIALCLGLFSLSGAGIPPTAGFLAKYFIFLAVVREQKTPLAVLAVISSLIGVYYYLRVLVYMYMKEPKQKLNLPITHRFAFVCILLCALSMVYFAIIPELSGLGHLAR